jgi:aspartate/methionine/tyrosine aminotransferase
MKLASRLDHIEPFYVMEVSKAAAALAAGPACDPAQGGRRMLWLNIGEPDFGAPTGVGAAAQRCIAERRTPYSDATGLPELREALSAWYAQRHGLQIGPERIVITAGASAALHLACLALFEPGDEVLLPDPSYPCNRHFVAASGASARFVATDATSRYQPTPEAIEQAWTAATRGVLLASPSNPTGTSIEPEALRRISTLAHERGAALLVDEIYLALSYEERYAQTALALGEQVISINSFSKYFGMTGWRLGWLVLPPDLVRPVEKLAQNLYICASTLAQRAALAAFTPEGLAECEHRRDELRRRRALMLEGLQRIGLPVPVAPDGAFYVWADVRAHAADAWDFCFDVMRRAQVALTPGRDFSPQMARHFVRLSFATARADIEEALDRLGRLLGR